MSKIIFFKCRYCGELYADPALRDAHEKNCVVNNEACLQELIHNQQELIRNQQKLIDNLQQISGNDVVNQSKKSKANKHNKMKDVDAAFSCISEYCQDHKGKTKVHCADNGCMFCRQESFETGIHFICKLRELT